MHLPSVAASEWIKPPVAVVLVLPYVPKFGEMCFDAFARIFIGLVVNEICHVVGFIDE